MLDEWIEGGEGRVFRRKCQIGLLLDWNLLRDLKKNIVT